MRTMTLVRRWLLLWALMFWQGGFTIDGGVVVPVGSKVTNDLELAGAVALAVRGWDLPAMRRMSLGGRRLRWAIWVGLVLSLILLVWLHPRLDRLLVQEDVIVLERDGDPRLAMRDERGKDRLELLVARDGAPVLNFLDREGKVRLEILVAGEGDPDLNFLDQKGAIRLNLGVGRTGAPELGLLDRAGTSGLMLTLTPRGAVVLDIDRDGKSRVALVADPDGGAALQFLDRDETPRLVLGLEEGGTPMWGALDARGKTRVGITITAEGRADLEWCDDSERLRLKLSISATGEPGLIAYDKQAKVIAQVGHGAAALLKSGAGKLPRIIEAVQDVLELWKLAEPLL
jgi:hypothetical protein